MANVEIPPKHLYCDRSSVATGVQAGWLHAVVGAGSGARSAQRVVEDHPKWS